MLEAAEAVFAEKGFEHATMEEVARRAGFSVGALYIFFSGKEALFAEVLRNIAENFYAAFRSEIEVRRPIIETIRAVLRLQIGEILEHGPFFRTIVATNPAVSVCPDSAIPKECRALYDRYVADMGRLFARAMAERVIRKQDPLYTALALEGVIHTYTAYWFRKNLAFSLEDCMARVERNFLNAIRMRTKGQRL